MRLDILGIQAFVAIAELGSFSTAAAYLCLSPTALSRRIKKLEEGVGQQLLSRTTRSVTLTTEGLRFLPDARRVITELAASLESLRAGPHHASDPVRLGCLPTLASLVLPSLLREYAVAHPRMHVQVLDRSAMEIRESLLRGEIDFAITVLGSAHPKIAVERIFSEPMVAACPLTHRFAKRSKVTWRELQDEPLISVSAVSSTRMLIEAMAQRARLPVEWTYQVEHLPTAVSLVCGGAGIAILPMAAVIDRRDSSLAILRLVEPRLARQVVLIRQKASLPAPTQAFYDLARIELQRLSREVLT